MDISKTIYKSKKKNLCCRKFLCTNKLRSFIVLQEVFRIRAEHPDDNQAVFNDRVKGQLKVTRAFGAGFLKRVSCFCKFNLSEKFFLGHNILGTFISLNASTQLQL
jgi:hypothetical protein